MKNEDLDQIFGDIGEASAEAVWNLATVSMNNPGTI